MRPKSIVLLMLALGCGLIASIGINQVLANRAAPQGPAEETTSIWVSQTQIEQGGRVEAEMLKLEPWPTHLVPAGAITDLADVESRVTRARIFAGEPMLATKLFNRGDSDSGATILIPAGYRVTPVKVDAVSGGSGLLQPGDQVDVLVFLEKNEGKDIPVSGTITLLQDVRVFAVNAEFRRRKQENDSVAMAKTISLVLTPEHVEMVTLAAYMGKIQLALRSPEDDEIVATTGQTAQELFGLAEASDRHDQDLMEEDGGGLLANLDAEPVEIEPEAVVIAPVREPDFTMIWLQDGEASRVTFTDGLIQTIPLEQGAGATNTQSNVPASVEADSDASESDEDTDSYEEEIDDDDFEDFDDFNFDDDDVG